MRIGVPVRNDYTEFVKIGRDSITNATEVTGFCIDVFKAVLEVLPYDLPYEFIPFTKPNGESAGTYDELISQVYYGVTFFLFSPLPLLFYNFSSIALTVPNLTEL